MSVGKIDYKAVLDDLEAQKAALEDAITGIRKMLGQEQAKGGVGRKSLSPDTRNSDTLETDSFFNMSIPEAAKKYLSIVKKPQSTKKIADALKAGGLISTSQNFPNNVRTILTRVERVSGDVVKVKKNWGLGEWYKGKNQTKR